MLIKKTRSQNIHSFSRRPTNTQSLVIHEDKAETEEGAKRFPKIQTWIDSHQSGKVSIIIIGAHTPFPALTCPHTTTSSGHRFSRLSVVRPLPGVPKAAFFSARSSLPNTKTRFGNSLGWLPAIHGSSNWARQNKCSSISNRKWRFCFSPRRVSGKNPVR